MRAAAARHPLGDIPLSVISRGLPNPLPAGLPAGLTTSLVERAAVRRERERDLWGTRRTAAHPQGL